MNSSSATRLLVPDATVVELPHRLPAGTEIVADSPRAATRTVATLAGAEIGVWEMTAGAARDVEADEVFVVIAGRGVVWINDDAEIDLHPGVVVRLHAGDRTEWVVTDALRKVYVTPEE